MATVKKKPIAKNEAPEGPMAFTAEQAAQLSGLSVRRLSYWDRTGFFSPRYRTAAPGNPYARIYSFRDVVGLRTISLLRSKHDIPLQHLRKLAQWFHGKYDAPWSELRFYVAGRQLFFDEPGTGQLVAARPQGQTAMRFDVEAVVQEVRDAARRMRERTPDEIGRIERHRYTLRNKPRLAGTRIPTAAVWEFHEAGYSAQDIIREFPRLTREDVQAAVQFEREQRQARAG